MREKVEAKIKAAGIPGSPGKTSVNPTKPTNSGIKKDFVPFGDDNMFPSAVEHLNRNSGVHRGVIINKVKYFAGKGFSYGEKEELKPIIEDLSDLRLKYFRDKSAGNAYVLIVKNAAGIRLMHIDHTKCRVGDNDFKGKILVHPNWAKYENSKNEKKVFPIYPEFDKVEGMDSGFKYSIYHVKDYEPEFSKYGIPDWIAAMNAGTIAYKTNKWNLSRLDNGYRISGAMLIDGEFKDEESEQKFDQDLDAVYTDEDNRGKILKIKKTVEGDQSKFIPFPQTEEGDWINLHNMSREELLIAHQWFPGLAGFNTSNGFDTNRILTEYQVALSQSIEPAQDTFMRMVRVVYQEQLNKDLSEVEFINRPPVMDSPDSMFVWEDRKARGLSYDDQDPRQQMYLSELRSLKPMAKE